MDAYWGKSDSFEHDACELYAHAMSAEEFIKKWKPPTVEQLLEGFPDPIQLSDEQTIPSQFFTTGQINQWLRRVEQKLIEFRGRTPVGGSKIDGLTPIEHFFKHRSFNYCFLSSRHQNKADFNKFYPVTDRGVVQMYYKEDIDRIMEWAKIYYGEET